MATYPSIPAAIVVFVCVLSVMFLLFVVVLSCGLKQNQERRLVDRKLVQPPVISSLAVPKRLFSFGSLVVLDVVCRYVLLFLLDIKIEKR